MPLKAYHIICMTFFKGLRCIKQNLPVPTFALQIQFTFQGNDLCVVHTNDFRHKYFSEVQEHRGMHKDAPRLVQCVQCSVLDVLFTGMQVLCCVESTEVCNACTRECTMAGALYRNKYFSQVYKYFSRVHDGWCIVRIASISTFHRYTSTFPGCTMAGALCALLV